MKDEETEKQTSKGKAIEAALSRSRSSSARAV